MLHVREGIDGEDRVLIDPHPMSPDHTISVSYLDISRDGRLVVYAVRDGGVDEVSIHLRDVDTGHTRHLYVQKDDVRAEPPNQIESFRTVLRFANDLHLRVPCEQIADYGPSQGLIIDDYDAVTIHAADAGFERSGARS